MPVPLLHDKQSIYHCTLLQLEQCKNHLRALENYTCKKIETSRDPWVSKRTLEAYEHCQFFQDAIERLNELLSKAFLSVPLCQPSVEKASSSVTVKLLET